MLCQFATKNYKSFRDEVTLDMQAAAISEHEDRIIKTEDGEVFLPVSVLYGPNGGGKSNVLEAIRTLTAMITNPLCEKEHIIAKPFAFSEEKRKKPTEFTIFFRTDLAEYRYIVYVKKDIVVYESLDRVKLDTGRRSALFVRDKKGSHLKGTISNLKIKDELADNMFLLSYLAMTYKQHEIMKDVIGWFQNEISFLDIGDSMEKMQSKEVNMIMIQMLQEMDLGIKDFRIEETNNNQLNIITQHQGNGYEVGLNLMEESQGTQKLFRVLPFIADSLLEGRTLIVDDLDAQLHPLLLRHIIMMFNDMSINQKGGQLVFTSSDLSTMNNEVFRRDEIWFVTKGNKENSGLYSLVEFKNSKGESVRKDAKYDKQYLEGKYGANPYLKHLVDWRKANEKQNSGTKVEKTTA